MRAYWRLLAFIGIRTRASGCISALRNRHNQPSPGLALEDASPGREDLVERDGLGHRRELLAVEVERQPPPGLQATRGGAMDAVDPEKRDAAQDEGRDRGWQVHALGEAAGRDRAAIAGLRQHIGERRRADAVDRGRPLLLAERLSRGAPGRA